MADWHDSAFLADAHDWIRSFVTVTGTIEQRHAQWWSTVLRVPTPGAPVWFKAVVEGAGYEPRLTELLAGLRPLDVPELIAIDTERGWMLMRDGGVRLRDLGGELEAWETILPAYAELQLATASEVGELLGLGVPDERLDGLPERLTQLLGDEAFLMLDEPDGLTTAERARLVARIPEVAAQCRELAGLGIPATIQHDDLHGGNVLVRDGRNRVLDWGDACVSHPFHSLTVLLRATAWKL
ncbi:MAG TPA: aminoglycoside phosphotransferase family protein, partial [Actinomycetota bacterium]